MASEKIIIGLNEAIASTRCDHKWITSLRDGHIITICSECGLRYIKPARRKEQPPPSDTGGA